MARDFLLLILVPLALFAQAKPEPDVLVFSNGERLVGHFVKAHGTTVTFKSDSVGEVNVDWSKIQELHTSEAFAILEKAIKLNRRSDLSKVPQGKLTMADQKLTVTPAAGPPRTIPAAEAAHVIDVPAFEHDVLHSPGILEGWTGALTAGASLVVATQNSHTITGGLHFVRALPTENWLDPRNRTSFSFVASTGAVTQPNTPRIKTEIVHADLERDQYFHGRHVYAFGQASFDHNYSQGLDLQQNYGGGIGWTAIKRPNTTLDLKGSVSYTKQQFATAGNDHNLIGSVFGQTYTHRFLKGIQFIEGISATPAWNEAHAWAAAANAALTVPVYKKLGFAITGQDSFINDPPPGFKKNSLQLTTGLTYTIR